MRVLHKTLVNITNEHMGSQSVLFKGTHVDTGLQVDLCVGPTLGTMVDHPSSKGPGENTISFRDYSHKYLHCHLNSFHPDRLWCSN